MRRRAASPTDDQANVREPRSGLSLFSVLPKMRGSSVYGPSMNDKNKPVGLRSAQCIVTTTHLVKLINAVVYVVGDIAFDRSLAVADNYSRALYKELIEAGLDLAEDAGLDLWDTWDGPRGRDEKMDTALILHGAIAENGLQECLVGDCDSYVVPCCARPSFLPLGTRWPTCPALCAHHTQVRLEILRLRLPRYAPEHTGPIDAEGMPLPAVAKLAPSPDAIEAFEISTADRDE